MRKETTSNKTENKRSKSKATKQGQNKACK